MKSLSVSHNYGSGLTRNLENRAWGIKKSNFLVGYSTISLNLFWLSTMTTFDKNVRPRVFGYIG